MHWAVAGPSFRSGSDHAWLAPHVSGDHQFTLVPRAVPTAGKSWHNVKLPITSLREWRALWKQSGNAMDARGAGGGVITLFPPLAAMVGLRSRTGKSRIPLVAYCFNMGKCYGGLRGTLARGCLSGIDRFIVHARKECGIYAQWLDLPVERFEFVHFQRASITRTCDEDWHDPFIVAMGSANRDYGCLFDAVKRLKIRTVVVAAKHAISGLDVPPNVEIRSGISYGECLKLAQRARINVVPLRRTEVGSGQVTFVDAMRLGRAVIASDVIGTEDYIGNGQTGLLVEPSDSQQLSAAIDLLWNDRSLRDGLASNAYTFAEQHLSDEAAGQSLGKILDRVGREYITMPDADLRTVA